MDQYTTNSGATHFNERLFTVVSFAYAYIAQRISHQINEYITQLGLDGRVDMFIIILTFSVGLAIFSAKQKGNMELQNKRALDAYTKKLKKIKIDSINFSDNKLNTNENEKFDDNIANIFSENMGNISILDQYLRLQKFVGNYLDFMSMIGTFLLVGYAERFFIIVFGMFGVSAWTSILIISPILFFLVSLKTMTTMSDTITSEIKTLVEN